MHALMHHEWATMINIHDHSTGNMFCGGEAASFGSPHSAQHIGPGGG